MNRSLGVVKNEGAKILADVPAANKAAATASLAKLRTALEEFTVVVSNKDKQEARAPRRGRCI